MTTAVMVMEEDGTIKDKTSGGEEGEEAGEVDAAGGKEEIDQTTMDSRQTGVTRMTGIREIVSGRIGREAVVVVVAEAHSTTTKSLTTPTATTTETLAVISSGELLLIPTL